jgi:hypothetical protein
VFMAVNCMRSCGQCGERLHARAAAQPAAVAGLVTPPLELWPNPPSILSSGSATPPSF